MNETQSERNETVCGIMRINETTTPINLTARDHSVYPLDGPGSAMVPLQHEGPTTHERRSAANL
jgi:hypothetical protein